MKIKQYSKSALSNAQVALSATEEQLMKISNNDDYGTENNPYSLSDMCEMVHNGTWRGGYVLIMGIVKHVGEYDFVLGSEEQSSSDYTVYPSEFNLDNQYNKIFSFIKPSSNFSVPSASEGSSEFSYTGSNIAVASQDYVIVHDEYRYSDMCHLSIDQMVYTTKVYVSISTGNACKERYIPSIKCAIQTASNYVTQVLYSKRNSNSTIRSNTPIANFGYYRLKDEQVMLIMDDNKPIYITY